MENQVEENSTLDRTIDVLLSVRKKAACSPDGKFLDNSWWIEKAKDGNLTLAKIYNYCQQAGCLAYYDEIIQETIPSETVTMKYMMNHTCFTKETSDSDREKGLKQNLFLYGGQIKDMCVDGPEFIIDTKCGKISYYQLTDTYSFRDAYLQKQLFTNRRSSAGYRCHELSYYLTCKLKAKGVTGFISSISGKILHSWVEKGDDCIDVAQNLVLNKEDFYRFYQPDVWNQLSYDEIRDNGIKPVVKLQQLPGDAGVAALPYYAAKKKIR